MEIAFKTATDEIFLTPSKESEDQEKKLYALRDKETKIWMRLSLDNNQFKILEQDAAIVEDKELIQSKLDDLVLKVIEQEQEGLELNEGREDNIDPYDPNLIKVHTKSFSIKLIHDMIESGDIDLNPNFQRNLVWNSHQKSRLIESILLRIPLPMFYFSEDEEGLITVVDGLQRLNTIKEYMDNKFPLKGLEYLKNSCEGKYYEENEENKQAGLEAKYFRWFNMTQLTVNVIDPASPPKVKYDIFRRINTGGKPLNNQEIRNCLANQTLRDLLELMTTGDAFQVATGHSIKSTRMSDQEVALRFICFYDLHKTDPSLETYNGNMEALLDETVESLNKKNKQELSAYAATFTNAMLNAHYLFDKYAFRKVKPIDLEPDAYKKIINRALFVSWSVLLADYDPDALQSKNDKMLLAAPLANKILSDTEFYGYLSYGTNGKANLQCAFKAAKSLIAEHLKQ